MYRKQKQLKFHEQKQAINDPTISDDVIYGVRELGPFFHVAYDGEGGMKPEEITRTHIEEVDDFMKNLLDVPWFHKINAHGMAVICLAAIINACKVTGKRFEDLRIVVRSMPVPGIAVLNLMLAYGATLSKCFLYDIE